VVTRGYQDSIFYDFPYLIRTKSGLRISCAWTRLMIRTFSCRTSVSWRNRDRHLPDKYSTFVCHTFMLSSSIIIVHVGHHTTAKRLRSGMQICGHSSPSSYSHKHSGFFAFKSARPSVKISTPSTRAFQTAPIYWPSRSIIWLASMLSFQFAEATWQ
jgi:hypothetical protein